MRHARPLTLAALATAVSVIALVALAQSAVTPLDNNTPVQVTPLQPDLTKTDWGDAAAGQAKAAVCAACHGADGNPPVELYPRIAGQSERYIARQMALIATGERNSGAVAAMLPFVQTLTAQDMRDIGAFFAGQHAGAGLADDSVIDAGPYKGLKFYQVGEKLYRGGDAARGIPPCMACHGPSGAGNPGPAYPRVGGQHASYLARRLQEYQSGQTGQTGEHDRGPFELMARVSSELNAQEIQALASYMQGLHDRADDEVASVAPDGS